MTLSEFKAWFEGFTEGIDGPPSAKQWKRIKVRVDEITDDPTPAPIIVERYLRPYWPYYRCHPYEVTWESSGGTLRANDMQTIANEATPAQLFNMAGKAEALELEAQPA